MGKTAINFLTFILLFPFSLTTILQIKQNIFCGKKQGTIFFCFQGY